MPATYSFSLNLKKDRGIIELMESAKNKSSLIRESLHSLHRLEVYKMYAEKLEKLCRTYTKELEWESPPFTRILNHCYAVKQEGKLELAPVRQEFHNSSQEQE